MKKIYSTIALTLLLSTFNLSFSQNTACNDTSQCNLTFSLSDALEDGWNGAYIELYQDDVSLYIVELTDGIGSFPTFSICDSSNIKLQWHSSMGNGTYDDEISFGFNGAYDTLVSVSDASILTDGEFFYEYTFYCNPSTCVYPVDIVANNITGTSMDLSWTNGSDETQWTIQYGPTGFTVGEGTMLEYINTKPYTIEGLNIGGEYDFYIRAECTEDFSYWSGPYTFSTICTVISDLPWSEDFESGIACYDIVQDNPNETWFWDSPGSVTHSGSGCIKVSYDDIYTQNELIISPIFDLSSYSNSILLEFWFNMSYFFAITQDVEDFHVLGTTDGGSNWDILWTEDQAGVFTNFTWEMAHVDLSSYAGLNNFQFAFRYTGLDGARLNIDDILIDIAFGLEENANNAFNVYPNPANSIIKIDGDINNLKKICISSVDGKKIYERGANSSIDISSLKQGVYFIQFYDLNNTIVNIEKIVKL